MNAHSMCMPYIIHVFASASAIFNASEYEVFCQTIGTHTAYIFIAGGSFVFTSYDFITISQFP